jgi:hypothetical protein
MKEWIEVYSTENAFKDEFICSGEEPSSYLLPWNPVKNEKITSSHKNLLQKKPRIKGHKEHRRMKDSVYFEIKRHLEEKEISGAYVGLAAAYSPEIFTLFREHLECSFVNCQISKDDFNELTKYQKLIDKTYSKKGNSVNFELFNEDINEYLLNTNKKFSVYDLDFMFVLSHDNINKMVEAISNSVKLPAVVAVWHASGRATTNDKVDYIFRPYLKTKLAKVFNISEYSKINYYEGFPMRCDVFTLEQKNG